MYRCEDCGNVFEEPITWVEYHGQPNLMGETWTGSPCCRDGYSEIREDEEDEDL